MVISVHTANWAELASQTSTHACFFRGGGWQQFLAPPECWRKRLGVGPGLCALCRPLPLSAYQRPLQTPPTTPVLGQWLESTIVLFLVWRGRGVQLGNHSIFKLHGLPQSPSAGSVSGTDGPWSQYALSQRCLCPFSQYHA